MNKKKVHRALRHTLFFVTIRPESNTYKAPYQTVINKSIIYLLLNIIYTIITKTIPETGRTKCTKSCKFHLIKIL